MQRVRTGKRGCEVGYGLSSENNFYAGTVLQGDADTCQRDESKLGKTETVSEAVLLREPAETGKKKIRWDNILSVCLER